MDGENWSIAKKLHRDREEILHFCEKYRRLHIYGAGHVAACMLNYLEEEEIRAADIIVSDGEKKQDFFHGAKVFEFSECDFGGDDGFILSVGFEIQESVLNYLEEQGINSENIYGQRIYGFNNKRAVHFNLLPYENKSNQGYFREYQTLDKIGEKFGTDKCSSHHNYLNKYEYFVQPWKKEPFTLLELGVYKGGSIRTWENYFEKATIYGVDIDEECKQYESGRCKILIQDLSNEKSIEKLAALKPAIIVDDASHTWSHQIKAIYQLFPKLSPGGIYIVEDIVTSFSSYRMLEYSDACLSTYEFLSAVAEVVAGGEYLKTDNHREAVCLLKEEIEMIAQQAELVSFMYGSCIMVKK